MNNSYGTNAEIRQVVRYWLVESDETDNKALRHAALCWIEELEAELKRFAPPERVAGKCLEPA